MNRFWPQQVAIAFDQLLNAILAGYADETLSARAHRCQFDKTRWLYTRKVLDFIFFWQESHCFEAYLSELQRKHYPGHYSNV